MLDAATGVFYAEGIHSVGVDRIIAEAQVTRATLYRHFSGKDELVLAYLAGADRGIRAQVSLARAGADTAVGRLRAIARSIADGIRSEGFRGCAFLNAVAEYPDPAHPIHQAVLAHRKWFLDTVTELLGEAGCLPASMSGRHFVMLRDGAMTAGCLGDAERVTGTFLDAVEGLLRGDL